MHCFWRHSTEQASRSSALQRLSALNRSMGSPGHMSRIRRLVSRTSSVLAASMVRREIKEPSPCACNVAVDPLGQIHGVVRPLEVLRHLCHGKETGSGSMGRRWLTAASGASCHRQHAWLPQLRCKLPQNGEARHVDCQAERSTRRTIVSMPSHNCRVTII